MSLKTIFNRKNVSTLFLLGLLTIAIGVLAIPRIPVSTTDATVKTVQIKGVKAGLGVSKNGASLILEIDWGMLSPAGPVAIERILTGPNGEVVVGGTLIVPDPPSEGHDVITSCATGGFRIWEIQVHGKGVCCDRPIPCQAGTKPCRRY